MKIAMVGSGATGSVFAAYLKMGGADVTLVDPYKAHMDKIASDGLLLKEAHLGKDHLIKGFHTAYTAEDIGIMDAVILMVKTMHTDEAMKTTMPCVGPDTVVVTLQNGLGNAEKLRKYVPANRVMYGSGVIGTELPEPGVCIARTVPNSALHFGALENGPQTDKVGRYLQQCFERGGTAACFDEDVRFFVWNKGCSNVQGNALGGIVGLPGGYFQEGHGKWLIDAVLREACDIANAMGVDGDKIYENVSSLKIGPAMQGYYSSTAQDMLMYKRETEIDSLNGAIVAYGKQLGIPTPYNEMITHMTKLIEENYDSRYKW